MEFRGNMQSEEIERLKELAEQLAIAAQDIGVDSISIRAENDGSYGVDVHIDKENLFHLVNVNDGDIENRWYARKDSSYAQGGILK